MAELASWIQAHPIAGAVVFVAFATLGKVTPIPGGAVVLLTGGFLFGPVLGPILGALGAALSAVLVAVVGCSRLWPAWRCCRWRRW